MFCNHNRIKLETNNKRYLETSPNIWKLINTFLNSAWSKGNTKENFKY